MASPGMDRSMVSGPGILAGPKLGFEAASDCPDQRGSRGGRAYRWIYQCRGIAHVYHRDIGYIADGIENTTRDW